MAPSKIQPARALILFDIDGTLLRRSGPHHREALVEAVRRVCGLETTTDNVPVQGMLDGDILTLMMRRAGATLAQIRRQMPAVVTSAESIYLQRCPDLRRKVCPGVRPFLTMLGRNSIPAGLVTGNLTRIGWKKLERAGIKHHFRFGAFSEQAANRGGLARIAVRQARREGWIGRSTPVALIGDHPNDIIAARKNSIRSIAVSTGLSSPEELSAHAPDLLVANLRELKLETLLEA
jgi:phosphoglycolate phosphatase-like HAD superfamily hydrolase